MKFLVQLAFTVNATPETIAPYQVQSAKSLWDLYVADVIREMHVRGDQKGIVFIAESGTLEDLSREVALIPLVQAGLLNGEIVRLLPFPDLAIAFQPVPASPAEARAN